MGPYRIEGVLGEGSTGRVYVGRTPAGAAVAVKVTHREFAADGGFRHRLELELAAVRRVPGLSTVPVVDADPRAERPWLASAYVAGPSLWQAVTVYGPGSTETVVRLVAGVADALRSLHAAGVVHRDLKPSNVLLTADGPRLTDCGLAYAADATSPYSAPEHVRGEEVTGAADVYALGLLAHFAATGRPAEPDLAGCPEPLRGIVAACVREDPRQRPTPAEVLQWCVAAAPPAAPSVAPVPPAFPPPHPPGAPGRRLTRRHVLLGAAGLAGVAGLGITIPILLSGNDDEPENRPTRTDGFRLTATLTGHTASVNSVAFSPDGRLLASMSGEDVRLWDLVSRKQRAVLTGQARPTFGLAFSPDGRLLASADDRTVRLWDVAGRATLTVLTGHTDEVTDLAFSPDGTFVASAAKDETVRLWDVPSGQPRAVLTGRGGEATSVDFHPGGRRLASGSASNAYLWDVPGGQLLDVYTGHDGTVLAVAFSPDGAILAASDSAGRVVLWNTEDNGTQRAVLGGHEKPMHDLAFSPDGRLLATAAEQVKLWDVAGAKPRTTLDAGDLGANTVAFSRTGALASGDLDARVRLWEKA